MFILDFIIISYYIFLRNTKQNQLIGSILGATAFPISFILVSVLLYLTGKLLNEKNVISPIELFVIVIMIVGATNIMLRKIYHRRIDIINEKCDRLEKYKYLFIPVIVVYFSLSLFLFFFTIRLL